MSVSSMHRIKVVLFCGGRGSATIIHELLRWPNIDLTLLVNAYDDGLSTGALRKSIVDMLGPSDFRKNLSYLLDPYSKEQYALKQLLELRLPQSMTTHDIDSMRAFIDKKKSSSFMAPIQSLFEQIEPVIAEQLRYFLQVYFHYAQTQALSFDYRDCSFGNLIFAGIYIDKNQNFNAAAKELSQLVSSRALLVNVSQGENRILVGLKENGELLESEARIVGPQSKHRIRQIFFMQAPVSQDEWHTLHGATIEEKEAWLREKEMLPNMSIEAETALANADIILYGPGTQHSSLFPSYRIVYAPLQQARAVIKALVMNLDADHDLASFSAHDIVDTALRYMGDMDNEHHVITHVLLSHSCTLKHDQLTERYKHCAVVGDEFGNEFNPKVHNGGQVVRQVMALWDHSVSAHGSFQPELSIFVDMHKRSLALTELYEEVLEINWKQNFSHVVLTINQTPIESLTKTDMITVRADNRKASFSEIGYFMTWLHQETSEYLILLTGDGKYRFQDVMLAINLLKQSQFGAVFGSRNQSRHQFKTSLRAAYGERKLLSLVSFLGSFVISAIFALRFGIIFSDPLTGFRIFKRSKIAPLAHQMHNKTITTPIELATYLINNHIEIAELPVTYRTFAGFVDPHWRIRRGMKSLLSTFSRQT